MKFYLAVVLWVGIPALHAQPVNQALDCEQYTKDENKIACMLPYAKQGDISAQARIGTLFQDNHEHQLAIYWLSKAADQQQTVAMNNLALAYEVGLGVKKDWPKALQLYTASAKLGSSHAQNRLGVIYQSGDIVKSV